MSTIYLYCLPFGRDVMGFALAEDGTALASHLSSNDSFSKHDLGLTSNWKHDRYTAHYPDGFSLEWVDNPELHQGLARAIDLNKKPA